MCQTVRLKYISALIYQYLMLMLRLTRVSSVTNEHLRKITTQIQSCTGFCVLQKQLCELEKIKVPNEKTEGFKTFSLHMKQYSDTCYKCRRKQEMQYFSKRIYDSKLLYFTKQSCNYHL